MLPTSDQIERAAYHIWQSRGQVHGRDHQDWLEAERELTFRLNYRTIVEFALDSSTPKVLGGRLTRHCRLCERTSAHVDFSSPRLAMPGLAGDWSLLTDEICDECYVDCLEPLAADLKRFWKTLQTLILDRDTQAAVTGRNVISVAAFKSLVAAPSLLFPMPS